MAAARAFHALRAHGETFNVDLRYDNLKWLGGGAYGSVCAADDARTGRRVAIKKCKDVWRHLDDAKRILREIKVLQLLGTHENLLWVSDVFVWPPPTAHASLGFTDLYLVSDLLETDLSRIIESPQPLSNSHLKYFTYQMLRGLKYLHSMRVL
jgi:mitogen-activated protein kinase 1/3